MEIESLSNSLNSTVSELRTYIKDIAQIVDSIAKYDLTITSQINYQGDFLQIQQSSEYVACGASEQSAAVTSLEEDLLLLPEKSTSLPPNAPKQVTVSAFWLMPPAMQFLMAPML